MKCLRAGELSPFSGACPDASEQRKWIEARLVEVKRDLEKVRRYFERIPRNEQKRDRFSSVAIRTRPAHAGAAGLLQNVACPEMMLVPERCISG